MKKRFYGVFSIVSGALVLIAALSAGCACGFYYYQPKVPKCLSENK